MKIVIKGTPKEIAELAVAVRGQQDKATIHLNLKTLCLDDAKTVIRDFEREFPNHKIGYNIG